MESSGIQWNPVESMWIMWGMVKYCMTWQAGDMEGACFVVDIGNVGVWLSCLVFRQLSWFVGSWGCSWWWGSLVVPWW